MAEASFGAVDVEAEDDEGDEEREAAAATPTALQALLRRLSTCCGSGQNLISENDTSYCAPVNRTGQTK